MVCFTSCCTVAPKFSESKPTMGRSTKAVLIS